MVDIRVDITETAPEDDMHQVEVDPLLQDKFVQVSQIVMRAFLLGMFVGKNQLQDDLNATATPLSQGIAQLQQQFEQMIPNSTQAAASNMFKSLMDNVESMNKAEKAEKKVKEVNQNMTVNEKKLNAHHDAIVNQLLEKMDDESKAVAASIVRETKLYKDKK